MRDFCRSPDHSVRNAEIKAIVECKRFSRSSKIVCEIVAIRITLCCTALSQASFSLNQGRPSPHPRCLLTTSFAWRGLQILTAVSGSFQTASGQKVFSRNLASTHQCLARFAPAKLEGLICSESGNWLELKRTGTRQLPQFRVSITARVLSHLVVATSRYVQALQKGSGGLVIEGLRVRSRMAAENPPSSCGARARESESPVKVELPSGIQKEDMTSFFMFCPPVLP